VNTFRPQDYAIAVLFIIAMIGPAVAGLACHLAWVGIEAAWRSIHG